MSSSKNKRSERALCFGSTRSRFYGIRNAPSLPGPFEYSREIGFLKQLPNKYGYTLLASRNPRVKEINACVPAVGSYNIETAKTFRQCGKPFGIGARLERKSKWITPPPGAHSFFKREVKVDDAFGSGPRIVVPLVIVKCGQFNISKCFKCDGQPVGDYWHKESTNQDMCRPCMENEWKKLKKCLTAVVFRHRRTKELRKFHLIRYCGFYHDHNGTKAAVQFMSTKDLINKSRKENYLASYGF